MKWFKIIARAQQIRSVDGHMLKSMHKHSGFELCHQYGPLAQENRIRHMVMAQLGGQNDCASKADSSLGMIFDAQAQQSAHFPAAGRAPPVNREASYFDRD